VEKERKEAAAARRVAAAIKAAGKSNKKEPRVVRVSSSVRTVSGGLPTLGKKR
jgi:hypothetical protein